MFDDIVDFLAGHYSTPRELEALLIRAFHDYPKIRTRLNLAGSPHDVATHVVDMLQRAEEIKPGTQALWHLLLTAREDFGYSVQKQIDSFRAYANKEQDGSPPPGSSSPPISPSSPNTPSSSSGPLPSTGGGPTLSDSSAGATGAGSSTGPKKPEWTAMQIAVVGAVIAGIFAIIAALITIFPPLIDRNEKLATQSALETQVAQTRAAQVSTASHTLVANTSIPQPTQITQLPTAGNTAVILTPAFTPTKVSPTSIANPNLTNTSTPPTGYPEQLALTPQNSNAAWKPVERDFDGVPMVLVPTGCFTMGSADGESDERPVQLMCFEEPFWMDKYEVSNAQYGTVGCEQSSFEPNQPRNCVTWFEARTFCVTRDARLPTESEWEYAARGPDGFIYPWGNTWDENNLVWGGPFVFNGEIAAVGSRPTGASWVGAEDMSGNVWEWVSSLRQAYSPNMGEGREDENNTGDRVLRGGRFNGAVDVLRAANRNWSSPDERDEATGFRCARDI